jgi:hypothetical protein
MAPRSNRKELADAWRALSGLQGAAGWRTIAVCAGGPCRLLAGRQTPGDEEALLIDLGPNRLPTALQLPQGRGFSVTLAVVEPGAATTWIGLSRRAGGSLDLFANMAEDIVHTLQRLAGVGPGLILRALLDRIRAWQTFMDRSGESALGSEAEIGLFGELQVFADMIRGGVPELSVCEAWEGPRDGVHDFRWVTGAIEVKTSTATGTFPARIGSIDQLDDSSVQPLFLAAVRLRLLQAGATLPELVTVIRSLLNGQTGALGMFEDRLLLAGFLDAQVERYTRRFVIGDMRLFLVGASFPRLTRAEVPRPILDIRYDIDLDQVAEPPTTLAAALSRIGVT